MKEVIVSLEWTGRDPVHPECPRYSPTSDLVDPNHPDVAWSLILRESRRLTAATWLLFP